MPDFATIFKTIFTTNFSLEKITDNLMLSLFRATCLNKTETAQLRLESCLAGYCHVDS